MSSCILTIFYLHILCNSYLMFWSFWLCYYHILIPLVILLSCHICHAISFIPLSWYHFLLQNPLCYYNAIYFIPLRWCLFLLLDPLCYYCLISLYHCDGISFAAISLMLLLYCICRAMLLFMPHLVIPLSCHIFYTIVMVSLLLLHILCYCHAIFVMPLFLSSLMPYLVFHCQGISLNAIFCISLLWPVFSYFV